MAGIKMTKNNNSGGWNKNASVRHEGTTGRQIDLNVQYDIICDVAYRVPHLLQFILVFLINFQILLLFQLDFCW